MSSIKKFPLIVFFGLAFLVAVPLFLLATPDKPVSIVFVFLLGGSYVPAIAALLVVRLVQDPQLSASFRKYVFTWKVNIKWYLIAALIPTLLWFFMIALGVNGIETESVNWTSLLAFPVIFVTNWGEEIGWRGFALPKLLKSKNPLVASLLLGFIWGCFHIPLYWQRSGFAAIFLFLAMALSIIITWLFLRTRGSVLIATMFHAVFNAWSQAVLPGEGAESIMLWLAGAAWVFAILLVVLFRQDFNDRQVYSP